ncbi:choline uptake/conversion transcriptional regulator CudC [Oceanobacillus alkalisoli]|uniref:choline uptake/conversion transcriptional regulator CudC n=1 Tax=Oceanobacillus alkalisoli TaxID=2925113 RepID=UPI001F121326|nr:GbsR/MarR family transcriptional regulator [Oceanobacillus alkalisoli]MCF3942831.1 GbsR/MarR family transcriptional regulator [Oceanobacillus alkalisoli]
MESLNNKEAREKLEFAKDQVIGAIAETMDLYGVTPAAGRLYATMYLEDKMNLDEMLEEVGMTKASMSTSVRKLQNIGYVKRVYTRGTRKHTYAAEKNFFNTFMSFYCQQWEREVSMNLDAVQLAEKELDEIINDESVAEEIREEAKEHYKLLNESKVYYRWLRKLVASIRSGEIFEFLPKENEDT